VIKEERRCVVVVYGEQYIGALFGQPSTYRRVRLEDRLPDGIVLEAPILRKPNRRVCDVAIAPMILAMIAFLMGQT